MNTFPKKQLLSLDTPAESPDREDILAADNARAYALAHAVKAVRLALASELSTNLPDTKAHIEEHPHQPNRWAVKVCVTKTRYNRWTDEDVLMYECVALASWENQ
jgi:hypothetical protein